VGLCGAQALHCCMWAFSSGRGYPLVECMGFSCCGSWASWPQGMWDLSSQTRDQTHVHVSLNLCSNNHMGLEVVILDTSPRTWDTKISGENWNVYEDFSGRNRVSLFWWILYFLVRVIWNSSNSRIVRKTTSTLFVFAFFLLGYNSFTMLYYFLLYKEVSQLCVYICPLPLGTPSRCLPL